MLPQNKIINLHKTIGATKNKKSNNKKAIFGTTKQGLKAKYRYVATK